MKFKKKHTFLILILICIYLIIYTHPPTISNGKVKYLHSIKISQNSVNPFIIHGNDGWVHIANQDWCKGSGTENDPYIIDNIQINAEMYGDSCLEIRSTDVYFIIQNSEFTQSKDDFYGSIILYNVSNGKLLNNQISKSIYGGIYVWGNDNSIGGNIIRNISDGRGILLEGNNNQISNNIIKEIADGISIFGNKNIITQNLIKNTHSSAIGISGQQNTISYNIIRNSDLSGLHIGGDYNLVKNNVVSNIFYSGISLGFEGNYNIITKNMIDGSTYGILVGELPSYNKIYENCILKCSFYNAMDYNGSNHWFWNFRGNYWDDYTGSDENGDGVGENPYRIYGDANAFDLFPLMRCPLNEGQNFPWLLTIVIIASTVGLVAVILTGVLIVRAKR